MECGHRSIRPFADLIHVVESVAKWLSRPVDIQTGRYEWFSYSHIYTFYSMMPVIITQGTVTKKPPLTCKWMSEGKADQQTKCKQPDAASVHFLCSGFLSRLFPWLLWMLLKFFYGCDSCISHCSACLYFTYNHLWHFSKTFLAKIKSFAFFLLVSIVWRQWNLDWMFSIKTLVQVTAF